MLSGTLLFTAKVRLLFQSTDQRGTRLDVPYVDPANIWAPSRRVTANFVESRSAGIENEHHVFYRGLGAWNGPVSVKSDHSHLYVENLSSETIPAAWV